MNTKVNVTTMTQAQHSFRQISQNLFDAATIISKFESEQQRQRLRQLFSHVTLGRAYCVDSENTLWLNVSVSLRHSADVPHPRLFWADSETLNALREELGWMHPLQEWFDFLGEAAYPAATLLALLHSMTQPHAVQVLERLGLRYQEGDVHHLTLNFAESTFWIPVLCSGRIDYKTIARLISVPISYLDYIHDVLTGRSDIVVQAKDFLTHRISEEAWLDGMFKSLSIIMNPTALYQDFPRSLVLTPADAKAYVSGAYHNAYCDFVCSKLSRSDV